MKEDLKIRKSRKRGNAFTAVKCGKELKEMVDKP
jgi:hypothetical protein